MKYISRFLVRIIIGMACVFFLNQVFDNAGVDLKVGWAFRGCFYCMELRGVSFCKKVL